MKESAPACQVDAFAAAVVQAYGAAPVALGAALAGLSEGLDRLWAYGAEQLAGGVPAKGRDGGVLEFIEGGVVLVPPGLRKDTPWQVVAVLSEEGGGESARPAR